MSLKCAVSGRNIKPQDKVVLRSEYDDLMNRLNALTGKIAEKQAAIEAKAAAKKKAARKKGG